MHVNTHTHFSFDYTLYQELYVQNEDGEISFGCLVYGNTTPFLDS